MDHEHLTPAPSFWKSPLGIVCTLVAIAASLYLWVAHSNHVLALLPYVFLAACPLMHMFMHGGHGGHGHQHGHGGAAPDGRANEREPRSGQGG